MPVNPLTWSSWNYLTRTNTTKTPTTISLTYNMNILQHISPSAYGPVLVTLNPPHQPAPHLTQGKWAYAHPLYNHGAVQAQRQLPLIQNKRGISYCGAWAGYGFHEDGFTSGLRVAVEHLGAKVPFNVVDSTHSRGLKPSLRLKDRIARVIIWMIQEVLMLWGLLCSLAVGMQGKVKST
jgi:predicted NAD/FAD-binding protein